MIIRNISEACESELLLSRVMEFNLAASLVCSLYDAIAVDSISRISSQIDTLHTSTSVKASSNYTTLLIQESCMSALCNVISSSFEIEKDSRPAADVSSLFVCRC